LPVLTQTGKEVQVEFDQTFALNSSKHLGTQIMLDNNSEIESICFLLGFPITTLEAEFQEIYFKHRSERNYMTVVMLGDVLVTRPGQVEEWLDKVDLVIHTNPKYGTEDRRKERGWGGLERIMVWPGFPHLEKTFMKGTDTDKVLRSSSILFSGSPRHRGREIYCDSLRRRDVPTSSSTHYDKSASKIPNFVEYADRLRHFEAIFANGYKYPQESIVVGKVWEAVLSGTTVLYEDGSWLDEYLEPYVHFVPIKNPADLVVKAKFILSNLEVSREIARLAREEYLKSYGSQEFWKQVISRLENINRAHSSSL
jgi:hypothetical protein